MKAGLFDVMRGRFSDGTPLEAVEEYQHRVRSVIDNLNRLFNHRQGGIDHLPTYGLPDLTKIYRDNDETIAFLQKAVREAVERYEPRLTRVKVQRKKTEAEGWIVFLLSGELIGGEQVQLETRFAEHVQVDAARSH